VSLQVDTSGTFHRDTAARQRSHSVVTSELDVPLDELVPLGDASRLWPAAAKGRRVSSSTVWGYATRGFGNGSVKLRTMFVPGVGRSTCARWISQFVAAVNAEAQGDHGEA